MASNKLSTNIIFNIINQVFNVVIPLITAPYIARVLSAELIGSYSYTLANSSYFVLFGCLGLALYGQIKSAEVRNNKESLSCLFWEITFLKVALSVISLIVYLIVFMRTSSEMNRYLYLIMAINIIANALDITWILNGLEEFKTMAIRNVVVRLFTILSLFAFVRDENDFYIYAVIMQCSTLLGYCSVFPTLRNKIVWPGYGKLSIWKHLAPSILYFVPGIINTIFTSTDKTMIGMMSSEVEVGFYEQANKICLLCMSIISSISNVLLPRAAYLFHNSNDKQELQKFFTSSTRVAVMIALPTVFGISLISDAFVPLFFGEGYSKSIDILKILCLNVFFVALSNFYGQQCLIARGKQKEYNLAISISALSNVVLNAGLIVFFQAIGAALASVISSVVGFVAILYFSRDITGYRQLWMSAKNYIAAVFVMYIITSIVSVPGNMIVTVIIQIAVAVCVYLVALIILRDEVVISIVSKLLGPIKKKTHNM